MVMCAGTAGAARSDCGGSRWRLHSLRTSTRSFCTPPVSLLPSLSLSTTPAKVRATLYSSRPLRRMASPMRMRGGGVVESGVAVIAGAGADAGEYEAAAGADDLAARADDDDATAGADVFALRARGRGAAEDAGDFAMRLEDPDGATVVASAKASVSVSLIAAGDASF